ncbi:MAG TPA: hypothetical protein VI522_07945 [Gammaproteobacteria bacterium]|nr:hypothetical protein [Gammaproteobacteria bacterium]
MHISLLLAKFFAIYFLVVSLPLLFATDSFRERGKSLFDHPGAMLLASIFTLILGIFLILVHNIWTQDWRLLVTILCWLTFIKGTLYLYCSRTREFVKKHLNHNTAYRVSGIVSLLMALYLGYHGFGF